MARETEDQVALVATHDDMKATSYDLANIFSDYPDGPISKNWLGHAALFAAVHKGLQEALAKKPTDNGTAWSEAIQEHIYESIEAALEPGDRISTKIPYDQLAILASDLGIQIQNSSAVDTDAEITEQQARTALRSIEADEGSFFAPIDNATIGEVEIKDEVVLAQALGNGQWRITSGNSGASIELGEMRLARAMAYHQIKSIHTARMVAAVQRDDPGLTLRPGGGVGSSTAGMSSGAGTQPPKIIGAEFDVAKMPGFQDVDIPEWRTSIGTPKNDWHRFARLIVAVHSEFQKAFVERRQKPEAWEEAKESLWAMVSSIPNFIGGDTQRATKDDYKEILKEARLKFSQNTVQLQEHGAGASDENDQNQSDLIKDVLDTSKDSNTLWVELTDGFALVQRVQDKRWEWTDTLDGDTRIFTERDLIRKIDNDGVGMSLAPNVSQSQEKTRRAEQALDEDSDHDNDLNRGGNRRDGDFNPDGMDLDEEDENEENVNRAAAALLKAAQQKRPRDDGAGNGSSDEEDDDEEQDLLNEQLRNEMRPQKRRRTQGGAAGDENSDRESSPFNEFKRMQELDPTERAPRLFDFKYNPGTRRAQAVLDSVTNVSAPLLYEDLDSSGDEAGWFDKKDAVPTEEKKPVTRYMPGMGNKLPFGDPANPMRLPSDLADLAKDPSGRTPYKVVKIEYAISGEGREAIESWANAMKERGINGRSHTEAELDVICEGLGKEICDDLWAQAKNEVVPSAKNIEVTIRDPKHQTERVKKNNHANSVTWVRDGSEESIKLVSSREGANLNLIEDYNARMDFHDAQGHNFHDVKGEAVQADMSLVIPNDPIAAFVEVDTYGRNTSAGTNIEYAVTRKSTARSTRFVRDRMAENSFSIDVAITLTCIVNGHEVTLQPKVLISDLVAGPKKGETIKRGIHDRDLQAINKKPTLTEGPFLRPQKAKDAFWQLLDTKSRVEVVAEKNRQRDIVNDFIDHLSTNNRVSNLGDARQLFAQMRAWLVTVNADGTKSNDYKTDAPIALRRFGEHQFRNRYQFDLDNYQPRIAQPAKEDDFNELKSALHGACREASIRTKNRVEMQYVEEALKRVYETIVACKADVNEMVDLQSKEIFDQVRQHHEADPQFTAATNREKDLQTLVLDRVSDLVEFGRFQRPGALADKRLSSQAADKDQLQKVKKADLVPDSYAAATTAAATPAAATSATGRRRR